MKPLTVQGRPLEQVGLPYHWGRNGYSRGDAANELTSVNLDPNVHIQEVKAFAGDIQPGRRPRGAGRAARRLPGRVSDRVAVPYRVRHGGGAGGYLQWLRLPRPGVPVRRDRPARG